MSENYLSHPFEPLPPRKPKMGLLGMLIWGAVCLALTAVAAAVLGFGWLVVDEMHYIDATATAEAQLPPPGWSPTIDEQFVSNENDWDTGLQEIEYGTADLTLEDGSYRWQLAANSKTGITWWAYPFIDHRVGDFYATAECRLVRGKASGSSCGLAFRIADGKNFYKFVVADDQRLEIAIVEKGEWVELLPWEDTDLVRPGEMNRVAILARGTHYRFFINGELAHELDNDQSATGGVGILADVWGENEAEFEFSSFQLYEP